MSPIKDKSSTCSSSVTDGSYRLLSQLNHPSCTDESAPIALKLPSASFCSLANRRRPSASSSPVLNTRMNVFGDSSIFLKFIDPPSSLKKRTNSGRKLVLRPEVRCATLAFGGGKKRWLDYFRIARGSG